MALIKGIDIQLFGGNSIEIVSNILVGEPVSSEDKASLSYTIAIPKGDKHDWICRKIGIFGMMFRTVGYPVEGIEENIPLDWNKKIRAELLLTNGSCTVYEKDTFRRHIYRDVYIRDRRGQRFVKGSEGVSGNVNIEIFAVNNNDEYRPQIGDRVVFEAADFQFDTTSERTISESLKTFRELYKNYSTVSLVEITSYCEKADIALIGE